jgi:hypothetical protein
MIADELDRIQSYLQDAATLGTDGILWSREELLRYYNEGYRQLLTDTQAVRRFVALDMPGRFSAAITYDWEQRYTNGGTYWQWTWPAENGTYVSSTLGDIPVLEDTTTLPTSEGITQQWERRFLNPQHQYYRFALPRNNDRIVKLWYNHRLLLPNVTRTLDRYEAHWMSLAGEPVLWTQGVGRNRTMEIYEILTGDAQSYAYRSGPYGFARTFSGSRTYVNRTEATPLIAYGYTTNGEGVRSGLSGMGRRWTRDPSTSIYAAFAWETQWLTTHIATGVTSAVAMTAPWEARFAGKAPIFPLGHAQHISSPERQYLGYPPSGVATLWGVARTWGSSANNLILLEVIGPEIPDLQEEETPELLPPQWLKYLRFYVLARAWSREGEGRQLVLAAYAQERYQYGVKQLQRLSWLSHKDQELARATEAMPVERRRPQRPRLPSTYPRVGR